MGSGEVLQAKEICGSHRVCAIARIWSVDEAHFNNSENESLAGHRSAKG